MNGDNEELCTVSYFASPSTSTSLNLDLQAEKTNGNCSKLEERRKRFHQTKPPTKLDLNADPRMIKKYVRHRWRVFADYTTLHGVKEVHKAPMKKLKILWLVILALCASMMLFQIYKLTAHFLTEPVTTTVTVKHDLYRLPLFLLVAHTHELFSDKPKPNSKLRPLDAEALAYAHSLVDKKVILPGGHDFERGKKKFDEYLVDNSGVTWHDALEPYMHDLSAWIGADNKLRVGHRSMWNIATYHILDPVDSRSSPLQTHDFIVEVPLSWHGANAPPMAEEGPASLILTSYGLLTDAIRLEAGHIYKIRFEMTSQRSVSLRRKVCRTDATQYLMYDQQKCNETCLAKAELKHAPRACYDHSSFEWGFSELYKKMRPCSYGFFNASGGPFSRERPERLKGASSAQMLKAYKKCFDETCLPACEQLSVRFSTTTREFGNDLRNRSLLFVTWPAPNAVPVYDEALQYTWDGFVGQLGGLIGLWMGASMVSAFEAFYLCFCCCYEVVSEEEYEDEERMYGMGRKRSGSYSKPKKMESITREHEEGKNGVYNMDDMTRNAIWLPRTVYD